MRAKGWGQGGGVVAVLGGVLALALACSSLVPDPVQLDVKNVGRCLKGTLPCGNGCMPQHAECCDNGTHQTSSYCIDPSAGPCQVNDRKCSPTASMTGTAAAFCCGNTALSGSVDCPEGQHHCGDFSCKPIAELCCPESNTAEQCPYAADFTSNGKSCLDHDGVLCGANGPLCESCPLGACCTGALTGSGFRCIPQSNVCAGVRVGGGSSGTNGGGGPCGAGELYVSTLSCTPLGTGGTARYCLSSSEYTSLAGRPLPKQCAPSGTTGCLGTTGASAGVLVAPCCPGLTCRVSSKCGDPSGAAGGTCSN